VAVAADTEMRRRHPGRYFARLRSAEPQPVTDAQRDELNMIRKVAEERWT